MKPKKLGIGDKPGSDSAEALGLLSSEGISNSAKLRGETKQQQPTQKKGSISSDRGKFKCR